MISNRRWTRRQAMGAAILFSGVATAQAASGRELVAALRAGGLVIYFRHTETGADYADQVRADREDCSTQRNLNDAGRRQAQAIGAAFRARSIRIDEVLSSPFCRCWQTAELAFGRHRRIDGLALPRAEPEYSEADKRAMRGALLPLLTTPPARGANRVIIAHDDNLPAAGGPELETQGEAAVIRPDGRGEFSVIAQLLPGQWTSLPR